MSLRVRDVAAQLNVSEKTVYKWLRAGLIPARRIGKTWIITEESVQAVLSPKSAQPTGAVPTLATAGTATQITAVEQPASFGMYSSEIDALNRFTGILSGAVSHGIHAILGPRGLDPQTSQTVAAALENAQGEVLLQGIGLREFFGDRGHTAILRQMAAEDRSVQVRAILVNPVSDFARARAVAEDGFQFQDEARFKGGPLYNDSWRSLNVIAVMKKEAEERSHFGIDVRFVDHWPSVYLVMTGDSSFVETYHFGKPDDSVDGSSIDGLVPMLQISSMSSYAQILRKHFDYIWSGTNPHIQTHSLADIAAAMKVSV